MLSVQQFLNKKGHDPCPHAPPFLFTGSGPKQLFLLFPQMKKVLKGKHFANVEEVKQKMAGALKGIEINKFRNCFEHREKSQ